MKLNKLFATFLTIAFALIIGLSASQKVSAQRYLSEIKDSGDVKGIVQFADNLSEFLKLADYIEQDNLNRQRSIAQLESAGKKIKDGTSNFRSNVKALVTTFKNKNQWNDELDSQINESLGARKIKGFYQRNGGGRKILTDVDAAINAINSDVDAIIANAKNLKASNVGNSSLFLQTSFAPNASARKVRFKCVVLGVAIFGAELAKATKTAENLDGFFDKSCGAGANTAT